MMRSLSSHGRWILVRINARPPSLLALGTDRPRRIAPRLAHSTRIARRHRSRMSRSSCCRRSLRGLSLVIAAALALLCVGRAWRWRRRGFALGHGGASAAAFAAFVFNVVSVSVDEQGQRETEIQEGNPEVTAAKHDRPWNPRLTGFLWRVEAFPGYRNIRASPLRLAQCGGGAKSDSFRGLG